MIEVSGISESQQLLPAEQMPETGQEHREQQGTDSQSGEVTSFCRSGCRHEQDLLIIRASRRDRVKLRNL